MGKPSLIVLFLTVLLFYTLGLSVPHLAYFPHVICWMTVLCFLPMAFVFLKMHELKGFLFGMVIRGYRLLWKVLESLGHTPRRNQRPSAFLLSRLQRATFSPAYVPARMWHGLEEPNPIWANVTPLSLCNCELSMLTSSIKLLSVNYLI